MTLAAAEALVVTRSPRDASRFDARLREETPFLEAREINVSVSAFGRSIFIGFGISSKCGAAAAFTIVAVVKSDDGSPCGVQPTAFAALRSIAKIEASSCSFF